MNGEPLQWREATLDDVELLSALNRDLIQDEGHHNPMSLAQLKKRMRGFLSREYRAIVFDRRGEVLAYLLYRSDEWDRVYIRQFFVVRAARRQGVGLEAMRVFRNEISPRGKPLILEVLTNNDAGRAFWTACGFRDYAVTLVADPRDPSGASHPEPATDAKGDEPT
jgi:ribosomal protein S18 acetylase RimI-like enzyme